jgi:hypothetical protein
MRSYAQILFISIFLAGPPSLPGAPLSAPEKNFEALWKSFHERYAFFKLRGDVQGCLIGGVGQRFSVQIPCRR